MKTTTLAILVGLALLLGCKPGENKYNVCEFKPGQIVRSVLSGQVGQVIQTTLATRSQTLRDAPQIEGKWCYTSVRFPVNQVFTDSRVLSDDGPISTQPLAVVKHMRPYELELVE